MRVFPALDLAFPPDERVVARVTARLDDFSPAAVHELGSDELPVWRVFFAAAAGRDEAASALVAEFAGAGLAVAPTDVPDEDWAARSQAGLSAVRVGRILVAPPWDVPDTSLRPSAVSPQPSAVVPRDILVVIKPSMGFGTGHHETTRLCLGLMQVADVCGRDVLDVGTGSGVLAIAAALLGAKSARGIDVDDDALASARENVALNAEALAHAGASVVLAAGNLREGVAPADLVVANLTGGLLVAGAGALRAAVRPGGGLLVSGFLSHESAEVISTLAAPGARIERRREGEWEAALIG